MKRSLVQCVFCCAVLATWVTILRGQEALTEPTGRAVQVITTEANAPVNKTALSRERDSGFWTSHLPRVTGWILPAGAEPVQVVNVKMRLIEDKARVQVSVFRGKRFGEIEELVADIVLALGETKTVEEIRKYGFDTLKFKLLATDLGVANVPLIVNPDPDLHVIVAPVVATLPAFEVSLTNGSKKDVMALAWHTEADGKFELSSFPRGLAAEVLIKPGDVYKRTLETHDKADLSFVIDAVIYADGTVAGKTTSAEPYFAWIKQDQAALSKIVPMLRGAADASSRADITSLITKIDALRTETNPAGTGIRPSDRVTSMALRELRELLENHPQGDEAELRNGFLTIISNYEAWLARLQK